eukprot:7908036-Alexandrium_andersonii.AAC.1
MKNIAFALGHSFGTDIEHGEPGLEEGGVHIFPRGGVLLIMTLRGFWPRGLGSGFPGVREAAPPEQ